MMNLFLFCAFVYFLRSHFKDQKKIEKLLSYSEQELLSLKKEIKKNDEFIKKYKV